MGLKPGQIYWGHRAVDHGPYSGAYSTRQAAIDDGQCEYGGEPFWVCGGPAIVIGKMDAWRADREPERIEPCRSCGGDGVTIVWLTAERNGVVESYSDIIGPCPDCSEIYGPAPPWADYPRCQECDAYGVLADARLECVGCGHTWAPTADERIMAERADAAGLEYEAWCAALADDGWVP